MQQTIPSFEVAEDSGLEPASGIRPEALPAGQSHEYLPRDGGEPLDERLFGEWIVRFLYSSTRERAPRLFGALTGPRLTRWLAYLNFDLPLAAHLVGQKRFLESCGVDLRECYDPPATLDTPRKIFERRIRYWHCRPMPEGEGVVVSPADARVLVGSLAEDSQLWIKNKFFSLDELLYGGAVDWASVFSGGDVAIFRLTPDKYHYNHVPVSGVVVDFYAVDGAYHASHPSAVVEMVTPYSKNRRVVTVMDTDVPGGSQVGHVAVVEVVALMIGDVAQCYSETLYDDPLPICRGMFVERGAPKSLFRPGSSTDVLLFQRGRIRFAEDLVANRFHPEAVSRLSLGFGAPMVETDVKVRSHIANGVGDDRGKA